MVSRFHSRWLAVLAPLMSLAGCVEKLDLNNPHDPESPQFAPDPPEQVQAVLLSDRLIRLSWTDISSFEDRYVVERRLGVGGAWTMIGALPPNAREYLDTLGVITDTTYLYRVSSVTRERQGISREISLFSLFPPPTGLSIGASSESLAVVLWNDNSAFESGFTLLRSQGAGPFTPRATTGADAVQAIDRGLLVDDDYSYMVRAFTSTNVSKSSTPIHVRCVPDSIESIMYRQYSGNGFGPAALSADGRVFAIFTTIYAVSPGPMLRIFVFNTETGELLASLPLNNNIASLALSADGRTLAGSTTTLDVLGWDIPGGQQRTFVSGNFFAPGLAISPDGKTLAAAGNGLLLFDIATATVTASWFDTPAMNGRAVFSPDGSTLYLIRSGEICRHNASSASFLGSFSILGATDFSFSANGLYVAGYNTSSTTLSRLSDGAIIGTVSVETGQVCAGGDGRFCIVSSPIQPSRGSIVDMRNRVSVRSVEWGSSTGSVPLSLALSPDAKILAVASGTDINVWRLRYRWRAMP